MQDYVNGGLKMLDINIYNLGLKSSWIKRILYSQETKWRTVPIEKILKTGSDYINVVKKEIKNPFWKDTLTVFQKFQEKLEVRSWDEFITQPIWNNPKIKIENKTVFFLHKLVQQEHNIHSRSAR